MGEYQFYPRAFSLAMPGGELELVKVSGNATLHTFGIVHVPPHPAFMGKVPYITAIVELEEDPNLTAYRYLLIRCSEGCPRRQVQD